ncbi:MAG TPA: hypothetical protein VFK47_11400 [Ktedonobacteraceae bacterium]|jgi:hypothetical protein|nr:hypothetical protein [Ktedonobacteraceae bacterium]
MIRKKQYVLSITLALAFLFLSACTASIGGGNSNSGGSNLTVLQLLQNSSKAMSQLKSAHIDLKANGSGMALTPNATATTTTGTPTATPTTNQVTFNLSGSGDEALPNGEAMQFDVTQNGATSTPTTSHLEQIVQGDKVYIKNTKGQWYVLDKSALKGYVDNPFSGINSPDLTDLIGLLEHTKITDNGVQSLNGANLRHITIVLDKDALKTFLKNNQQLVDLLGQQNLNAVIDNTKAFSSTVDLWIDEHTAYVHRTELKFNFSVDTGTLSQSITPTVTTVMVPSNVTTNFDSIVDLSNFNAPVTITPPTNAIATDNPVTVFS